MTPGSAFEARVASLSESLGEVSAATREAFASLVQRAVVELVENLGPVHERDLDLRYAGEVFLVTRH